MEIYIVFKNSLPVAKSYNLRLAKGIASDMKASAIVMYMFSGSINNLTLVPTRAWRFYDSFKVRWNECPLSAVGIKS